MNLKATVDGLRKAGVAALTITRAIILDCSQRHNRWEKDGDVRALMEQEVATSSTLEIGRPFIPLIPISRYAGRSRSTRIRFLCTTGNPIPCSFPDPALFRLVERTRFSSLTYSYSGAYDANDRANVSIFPVFFPVSREFWLEKRFARDCVHRHSVWISRICRENRAKTLLFGPFRRVSVAYLDSLCPFRSQLA
jgi:hypothetical protein